MVPFLFNWWLTYCKQIDLCELCLDDTRQGLGPHTQQKYNPSCKKSAWPLRMLWWKKMWNPNWRPRNGCDCRFKAKILIMTIHAAFSMLYYNSAHKFTWIVIIKILPLAYHHSHFLATTLVSTTAFLRAAHFFTAGLFGIRFHFFL